jgi:hypothetical protein
MARAASIVRRAAQLPGTTRAIRVVIGFFRRVPDPVTLPRTVRTCENATVLRPDVDLVLRPPQPPAQRVVRRALALCAVACRSQLEPHAGDAEARAIHESVRAWLAVARVDAEMEDEERDIVATPLGQLSRDAAASAGWRGEGAATLAWGLGLWTLPAIDAPVDASDVAMQLDWLGADPSAFCDAARLRARSDVVQFAEMLEVTQWQLDRSLEGETAVSLRNFDAGSFSWPRDVERLVLDGGGDLVLGGQSLAVAPEHARRIARRIVVERRRAVNWLAGQNPVYSQVELGS